MFVVPLIFVHASDLPLGWEPDSAGERSCWGCLISLGLLPSTSQTPHRSPWHAGIIWACLRSTQNFPFDF